MLFYLYINILPFENEKFHTTFPIWIDCSRGLCTASNPKYDAEIWSTLIVVRRTHY